MLKIVEVPSKILVLISQVAELSLSDTIYPNLGQLPQKRRKSTFLTQNWSDSTSDISDVHETYVDNNWAP